MRKYRVVLAQKCEFETKPYDLLSVTWEERFIYSTDIHFHPLSCVSRLRIIHAKKTGKRDASGGGEAGEEQHPLETPAAGRKRRRKGGDSDYDDDDDDDSDDQADDDEEDEEDKEDKKGKKTEVCEDEVGDFKKLH